DFGIAKIIDPAKLGSDTQGQPTRTGALLGTPHYMSYEQAMSDKRVDQRTDVWAIGVILFEALTGRRPLVYETLGEMYTIFLQGQVPSITRFVPDIPPEAAAVIDRSLAKLPADRASDLGPLIEMLAKYSDPTVPGARCGGRGVAGAAPTENESTGAPLSKSLAGARRRGRKGGARPAVVLAAVASLAAVAGAGGLAWRSRSPAATLEAARPTPSLASTIAIAPPPEPSAVPALVVEAAAPTATHRRSLAVAAGDAGQGADARSPTESPHGISSKLPY
ncbi:MAG TPA: serine/threonine protein kinase, partial [Polyangiaceae bacterium]|nr:serine/threonine protein kinase [Polyangiaceae bacterium]